MRTALSLLLTLLILLPPRASADDLDKRLDHALRFARRQLLASAHSLTDATRYPRSAGLEGGWNTVAPSDWTSGFYPGCLWLMYEATKDETFRIAAERWTAGLEGEKQNRGTHDIGFMTYCSFGNGLRLTGNPRYREVLQQAAWTLGTRYRMKPYCIKSWDWNPAWQFPVIIDNMMNLELLFWAAKNGGESDLHEIALTHALTTRKNHFRPDGGTYHVVEYDTVTGGVLQKMTHQGSADESVWARGQAWAIHGFTMAYRETGDERLLAAAESAARYFIDHLPPDGVPYWDFQAPGIPAANRDASAGAIAASGLLELSTLAKKGESREKFLAAARLILSTLSAPPYLAEGTGSPAILNHAVGNMPRKGEVDVSLIYGDYYFLEAILRYRSLGGSPGSGESDAGRQERVRKRVRINEGWEYCENAAPTLAEIKRSDSPWEKINLPHTWNAFDAVDNVPGYRRDGSWYRKTIRLEPGAGRVILEFEGVNMTCELYVNGHRAGGHVGGYVGFSVDITPWVNRPGENLVMMRVDNRYDRDVIPSQKSDFFIYGGITRDVWLSTLPSRYVERIAVTTPEVTGRWARVNVDVVLQNSGKNETSAQIKVALLDRHGDVMLRSFRNVKMKPGRATVSVPLPLLLWPDLWSPADPALSTVVVTLSVGGKMVDEFHERFGFRWFEFRDHGPFLLNGERLLLRGTHRHEEYAGVGNALPDTLHRKDVEMIKAMGANFIRLAHYPQDPEVYRACDELGILVWDELPWCRGGMGGAAWRENTKRLLREQILQNFNHPSIIIWSLGNEFYWLPDFPGGDNMDSLRTMTSELNSLAHSLDPGRKTAARKFYEGADIPDLFSPSIWAGWYSGVYRNYEKVITEARAKYPRLVHVEYGGDSHPGRHSENPVDGEGRTTPGPWDTSFTSTRLKNVSLESDWSETYLVDLIDWHLHVTEGLDWFTGNAQWAFKDFGTPLRPENPIPYVNQKGIVDRGGKPKDVYYVFKSYWTTDPRFCYIESHTWDERSGPEGLARPVRVYSNCEEVELFLNGLSLGRKRRDSEAYPAHGLTWGARFQAGKNQLLALGWQGGREVARDSTQVRYTAKRNGPADRLELSAERLPDGRVMVTARALDKEGLRCLDYNKRVYFSMSGEGRLAVDLGTPTGSPVIEMANGVARIEFIPSKAGRGVIEVRNMEFRGAFLSLDQESISHISEPGR